MTEESYDQTSTDILDPLYEGISEILGQVSTKEEAVLLYKLLIESNETQ